MFSCPLSFFTTHFSASEDAPIIASITATCTSILVSWDPVTAFSSSGVIPGYQIQYVYYHSQLESQQSQSTTTYVTTSVTLEPVEPGTQYNVTVSVITSFGAGPATSTSVRTGKGNRVISYIRVVHVRAFAMTSKSLATSSTHAITAKGGVSVATRANALDNCCRLALHLRYQSRELKRVCSKREGKGKSSCA